jgi:hypothetical protein
MRKHWRRLLLLTLLFLLISFYIGSYYCLSRRGMSEASEYRMCGFLYMPFDEVVATEDLSRHRFLSVVYAPLNWIDRQFFGGDDPVTDITFRLSSSGIQPEDPIRRSESVRV